VDSTQKNKNTRTLNKPARVLLLFIVLALSVAYLVEAYSKAGSLGAGLLLIIWFWTLTVPSRNLEPASLITAALQLRP